MPIDKIGLLIVYGSFVEQGGIGDGWGQGSNGIAGSRLFGERVKMQQG